MQHVRLFNNYNGMNLMELTVGWLTPLDCLSCGSEGSVLCEACSTTEIIAYGQHCFGCGSLSENGRTCPKCRRLGAPRYVWISTTYEGVAKKLINSYKFAGTRLAAEKIAQLMADTLSDFNRQSDLTRLDYLLVPVPTATSRRRRRSFDHARLLAKHLGSKTNMKLIDALGRLGQSRQVGARREVRLKQLNESYWVRLPYLINGRNILLIDDVVTTGASLSAAGRVLRQAGAKRVDALVFAKRL